MFGIAVSLSEGHIPKKGWEFLRQARVKFIQTARIATRAKLSNVFLINFYFRIISDFQRSCKANTDRSPIFHRYFPSYISMIHLPQRMNQYTIHYYKLIYALLEFLQLLPNAFFCPRISPRIPHYNQSSCTLQALLGCVNLSDSSCFW